MRLNDPLRPRLLQAILKFRVDTEFPDLTTLPGYDEAQFDKARVVDWVPCDDLMSGNAHVLPYSALAFSDDPAFRFTTNGMGVSGDRSLGLRHAIEEAIERHVISTSAIRLGCLRTENLELFDVDGVLPRTLSDWLVRRDGALYPLWIANDFGFHVFMTFLSARSGKHDDAFESRRAITVGYGCSDDIRAAFQKSLKESLQVRLAYASGARSGLREDHFHQSPSNVQTWLEGLSHTGKFQHFRAVGREGSPQEWLKYSLSRLYGKGIRSLLVYEFSGGVRLPSRKGHCARFPL